MSCEIIQAASTIVIAPFVVIDDTVIAICPDPVTARRVAQLIDRHGLVDVPDTPPALPLPDVATWAGNDPKGPR